MISPDSFVESLQEKGIGIFAGVPDSLLKNFCAYIDDHSHSGSHVLTANEGNAIAIAAGYYLASGEVGAVYMQNSGLGNAINPLTSLVDKEVYSIPVLLIIGWRGEPGVKDEPQHIKQGAITLKQLELLGIPYLVLGADSELENVLDETFSVLRKTNAPVALVVRKNTFSAYKRKKIKVTADTFKRENAIRQILEMADPDDLVISTTGKTSREVYEIRKEREESIRDFLTVGSMGHTASIALGLALGNPNRKIFCLDGDGSLLMHLGALPIIGSKKPCNLVHILLNNGEHESVGGQPTVARQLDFPAISKGCCYRHYHKAINKTSLMECLQKIKSQKGPVMLEVQNMLRFSGKFGAPF